MGGGGSRAVTFARTAREMRLTEGGDCKTPKELHTPLSHPHLLYSAISVNARNDSSPLGEPFLLPFVSGKAPEGEPLLLSHVIGGTSWNYN